MANKAPSGLIAAAYAERERLARELDAQGLYHREIAERLGISRSRVQEIVSGGSAKRRRLDRGQRDQ